MATDVRTFFSIMDGWRARFDARAVVRSVVSATAGAGVIVGGSMFIWHAMLAAELHDVPCVILWATPAWITSRCGRGA